MIKALRFSFFVILALSLFHASGVAIFPDRAETQTPNREGLAPAFRSNSKTAQSFRKLPVPEKNFGQLPIYFELNRGQAQAAVNFIARNCGATILLTATEAVFSNKWAEILVCSFCELDIFDIDIPVDLHGG